MFSQRGVSFARLGVRWMSEAAGSMRATVRAPRTVRARPAVLDVTEAAAVKIKELLANRPDAIGLRVGVKTKGCSGNVFHLEYATEKKKFEEEIVSHGVKVLIEPTAIMKILNSTMDYVEDDDGLKEEFVFENPQVKGTCGCGESWHM